MHLEEERAQNSYIHWMVLDSDVADREAAVVADHEVVAGDTVTVVGLGTVVDSDPDGEAVVVDPAVVGAGCRDEVLHLAYNVLAVAHPL